MSSKNNSSELKTIQRGVRLTEGQNSFLHQLAKQTGSTANKVLCRLIDDARQQKTVAGNGSTATHNGSR